MKVRVRIGRLLFSLALYTAFAIAVSPLDFAHTFAAMCLLIVIDVSSYAYRRERESEYDYQGHIPSGPLPPRASGQTPPVRNPGPLA